MTYNGFDFSTFLSDRDGKVTASSMDLNFTPIEGPQVCAEVILRKLMCPPGSMDDPTWGVDLRGYLNASLTPGDLGELSAVVRTEILKEEFVDDAAVVAMLSLDGRLIVDITLTLADEETFAFAFALSKAGIEVILDVARNAD